MHAALVDRFDAAPRFGEAAVPVAQPGELLIRVQAAALSNLVRAQANGTHYSAGKTLPFTPGNDGVGTTQDGRRVYFFSPRMPHGSMAEYTVVPENRTIPLDDRLDTVKAAAMGNPGIATWGALLGRAHLVAGETVLVNGATGTAGQQAVQVAKYLGARRVLATGRNPQALEDLRALGADETISLLGTAEELTERFRAVLHAEGGVQVVLDYLWGPSAEALLRAASGHGGAEGEPRFRFVQVGSISGDTIALPAHLLRSSGVELLGSGLGSLSAAAFKEALTQMYRAAATSEFVIDTEVEPLRDVAAAWAQQTADRRIVFLP